MITARYFLTIEPKWIFQLGWFPSSFVTPVANSASSRKSELFSDNARSPSTKSDVRDVADSNSPSRQGSVQEIVRTPFKKGEQRAVVKKYVAELPKQISLNVSDVVVLLNERNGWFQGNLIDIVSGSKISTGWFPSICVSAEPLVLAPSDAKLTESSSIPSKLAETVLSPEPAAPASLNTTPVLRKSSNRSTPALSPLSVQEPITAEELPVIIKLLKSGSSLGVGIVGGKGTDFGDLDIFVNQIVPDSAAAHDGRLAKGDQIIEVNGSLSFR